MDGIQTESAPAQVSRRKIPSNEPAAAEFVAAVAKLTKRPVALIAAEVLAALACMPSVETDTRCVEAAQPDGAPAQVSRTNTSATPLVSLSTRFRAVETNAT